MRLLSERLNTRVTRVFFIFFKGKGLSYNVSMPFEGGQGGHS